MILPDDFATFLTSLLGDAQYKAFYNSLACETPPVSIRINKGKWSFHPQNATPVLWSTTGFYLQERPSFTFDPLFHAGAYYVQEASSMFLEQVLRQYICRPVTMLDLCAAPGGKSTLACSVLPKGSLLVSNEVMRNRVQVLVENMVKWGSADIVITNNDAASFAPLRAFFDVVLADVPCSGEGMFRKDPQAVQEWSLSNVEVCWQRQRHILRDVWDALKPGGLLIYSTCTYNRKENEDNINWVVEELGADVLPVSIPNDWGIQGNLSGRDFPVYRFLPHCVCGEGLFMAVLRKHGENKEVVNRSRNNVQSKKIKSKLIPNMDVLHSWLSDADKYVWQVKGQRVTAFPFIHNDKYDQLCKHLNICYAGITVAECKGKDYMPAHALAMSVESNIKLFHSVELSYEQAVSYLRKESIILGQDIDRGYVLVTFRNLPLGFVKNIGNRANNLYPQDWRIRSGFTPEKPVNLFL